jgi:hypothetical protein
VKRRKGWTLPDEDEDLFDTRLQKNNCPTCDKRLIAQITDMGNKLSLKCNLCQFTIVEGLFGYNVCD